MKDQYFGDINDYRKYGLLRVLQSHGDGSLLVAWMLTPNDGSTDGQRREYIARPNGLERLDPDLYNGLRRLRCSPAWPSVSLIERSGLLPRTSFFATKVPVGQDDRIRWRRDMLGAAGGADLVFLDPDTGVEVPSMPRSGPQSTKYVMWCEIESLYASGSSVLIYQHFPRVPRKTFAERMAGEVRDHTGAPQVTAFLTAHVMFLLAPQPHHRNLSVRAIAVLRERWAGEIAVMECSDARTGSPDHI